MGFQYFIPIFLCTDNNYAVPTYIAIFSLLQNYHGVRNLKFYILTSKDFTESNKRLLTTLKKNNLFVEMHIINMVDCYNSVPIANSRISTATMYRLLIPKIAKMYGLNIEKCIYLDSDVVVEGDINEIYNLDIKSDYVGGVRDRDIIFDRIMDLKKKLDIPNLNKYINAGVLLLNLKKINNDGIHIKLEDVGYKSTFRYNDQDVINSVCFGSIKVISDRFNVMVSSFYNDCSAYEQLGFNNIMEVYRNPLIVHYNSARKPWLYNKMFMADIWWKYVRLQEKTVQLEYIYPFIRAHKLPLRKRIVEALKTWLVYLGLFNVMKKLYNGLLVKTNF